MALGPSFSNRKVTWTEAAWCLVDTLSGTATETNGWAVYTDGQDRQRNDSRPGGTEWEGVRFYHSTQNGIQLKTAIVYFYSSPFNIFRLWATHCRQRGLRTTFCLSIRQLMSIGAACILWRYEWCCCKHLCTSFHGDIRFHYTWLRHGNGTGGRTILHPEQQRMSAPAALLLARSL